MSCYDNCREDYKDEDKCHRKPKKENHKKCLEQQKETILRCGTSSGSAQICCNSGVSATLTNGIGGGYGFNPTPLATVALDTSGLIDPTIKINFSSLINFRTTATENYFLRLVFKLSKVCGGGPIPLGTWAFEKISQQAVTSPSQNDFLQETDPFSFTWCECDDCPDCCRYIVEIVNEECFNINFASINNISLTAEAVGKKKSDRY